MTLETKEKPQSQDAPSATGEPSGDKPVKTYPESDYLKVVSEREAALGRLASVTKERDTFKTQAAKAEREKAEATAAVEEREAHIADLESDLENADNADAAVVAKLKKELRTERIKLQGEVKAEKEATAAEKEAARVDREQWATIVAEAQAEALATNVFEAVGYDPEKATALREVCDTIVATSGKPMKAEEIKVLSDKIWPALAAKKEAAPANQQEPTLIVDSGRASGGSKGRKPTLAELQASTPEATEAKVRSGEWVLPGWRL